MSEPPRTLGARATLLVLVMAALVLFAGLGYRATLTEHEVYAAEPAREMLAGGPLLLQPFAGALRVKKPPGQSWLIAASMGLTRTQNEYTARLPSAIAATLLALLLGAIGSRLASRRVGLIAAMMTLTTYGVQARARLAEADMALALTIATAFAAVLWALRRRESGVERSLGPAVVFWSALVAGVLLKGPIPLGFVLPPLAIAYAILRWRGDRKAASAIEWTVLHPAPLVGALLLVTAWVAAAVHLYPGIVEAWRHEVVDRATGGMRRDSPFAYLGLLPLATLPWCPFAVVAVARQREAWRAALQRPAVLVLALWAGVGFVVISCVALKALHYTLPIVPPLILLAASGFDATTRGRREKATFTAWFGIAALAWIASQFFIQPRRESPAGLKPFAAQVDHLVPGGEPIYLVGVGEERTAFYLQHPLVQTKLRAEDDIDAQLAGLPADTSVYVLCRVPNIVEIAARMSMQELLRSDDFRGRGEEVERRALLLVQRMPSTQPVREPT